MVEATNKMYVDHDWLWFAWVFTRKIWRSSQTGARSINNFISEIDFKENLKVEKGKNVG